MDYKSFEYMRKTLPNEFNWSILYQLFKEDEIELSEAAENYLRTTPWNTNLTIFEEILNDSKKESGTVLFQGTITVTPMPEEAPSVWSTSAIHEITEFIEYPTLKIIINTDEYILSKTWNENLQSNLYKDPNNSVAFYSYQKTQMNSLNINRTTYEAGDYNVRIEIG